MAALALVITALGGAYGFTHFAMTTDTAGLISAKTPWRQRELAMSRAFPQNDDQTVVVIDGATPELAERAAAMLSARLAQRTQVFESVRRPEGGPFFAAEGLLLQPLNEVQATTAQLIAAQPFLGPLAADPSLRGVAQALSTLAQGARSGQASLSQLDRPFLAMTQTLDAVEARRPAFFSWQSLVAASNPGATGGLAAPMRRFILVQPRLDYGALTPGAKANDVIREDARALELDPAHGATVRLTGTVPLSDEEFASLADNIGLVVSVMLGAVLLMLYLAVRSIRLVLAILVTTIAGLVLTAGLGLMIVHRFNLISVAFIPLFVGLGVDFGIQFSVRFRADRADHAGLAEALATAAGAIGGSLALAAAAVTLGFLAFLPTRYIGVSELGVIAAVGMVIALVLALTLLPALIMLLRPPRQAFEVGWRGLAPVDRFLVRRRRGVLAAFVVCAAATVLALPLVRFDFNPFHLRNPNGEAMRALADLFRDPSENPNTINVLTPSPTAAAVMATRLSKLPQVAQAVTLESFIPTDQPQKLAAIADAASLLDLTLDPLAVAPAPTDAEAVAALRIAARDLSAAAGVGASGADARRLSQALQRLSDDAAEARARAQTAFAQPLQVLLEQLRALLSARPVTMASLPPEIVDDWVSRVTHQARVQVSPTGDANDNANLIAFSRAVQAIAPDASGAPISIRAAGVTIAWAFIQAGALSLVAITALLFLVLRNAREVAFTLAPILLSIFLTLGSCVVIEQPINFANIIAFPLLVGVGVAFHIYFVMAWRAGQDNLLQSSLARGVLFSALTTGAAFGSLWLSSHPGTASMGKLLMISLFWTLVCALIFEPALLGPSKRASTAPA